MPTKKKPTDCFICLFFQTDICVQMILWHFCISSAFTGQSEPGEPATSKEREFTSCRNWVGCKSGSDLELNSESRLVSVETENYVERNISLWKGKCGLPLEHFKYRIPACIKICNFIEIFLWRRNSEGDRVVEIENMWAVLYNPYPTAFPYGNGMVLHFYQQQENSTTKTVHKVINKRLNAYV